MKFDLQTLADRLTAASARAASLSVEVTQNELVFSKDGHGTGRSESVPFAALFLREDDVVAQAIDRLGVAPPG